MNGEDTGSIHVNRLGLSQPTRRLCVQANLLTVADLADAAPILTEALHTRASRRMEAQGVGGPTLTFCARSADEVRAKLREIAAL